MAIAATSPPIVAPAFVILLEMITAMYDGTLRGGAGLLPGPVVHVPPQRGGVTLSH